MVVKKLWIKVVQARTLDTELMDILACVAE